MPLSFRPNAKVWIWLESDAAIEESQRQMFEVSVLSSEKSSAWVDALCELLDRNATYTDIANLLAQQISGWKNFPDPFSSAALRKHLTNNELKELAIDFVKKLSAGEDELKKSVLQSQSNGAASASPAPVASAIAPQPSASPS